MGQELVIYQFSRSRVGACDFKHFLDLYAPEKLPTGRQLRELMNSLTFVVEGFDDDPREIHSIPEVRRFYGAFRDAWPYWLYFCSLETEGLLMMVLCCLPSMAALKVDAEPGVKVEYDRLELLEFLRADFGPMNAMCERAGMFEDRIRQRTKSVFGYFDLPFEST